MDNIQKSYYLKALDYHNGKNPGKISITPTKPLVGQCDLALAYSPWVSAPCLEIIKDPDNIYKYTSRGNMVAVISNGTAVLGLGNLGAAASKPVMEGKAVLFKNFADIDAVDIEVDTSDPEEFINVVKYLGYSFGGINLEDIKAPECFVIEEKLKELMSIPVFHDDQHGTAIITAAALINSCYLQNKTFADLKIVVNGAGAAAIACLDLLVDMGVNKNNVILCDTKGVIYAGRIDGMNKWKERYASNTQLRTLEEVMVGADVFLGLSVKGALTEQMVKTMANKPIIFALANPDPEITPEIVKNVRSDAIIATGRSDYNNQVNNVMGFPYIFRGTLDVRATKINQEMKIAAANAIAELARESVPDEVHKAYSNNSLSFGPEYIIPVPFDPRLITTVPVAVAKAAIESGATNYKNFDLVQYKNELAGRLNPVANYMSLLFQKLQNTDKINTAQRIVFAEGEETETIKAAIIIRDNGYAKPILVGRMHKIEPILAKLGSQYNLDGITVINAAITSKLQTYIDNLYNKLQRQGFLYRDCAKLVKSDRNVFAACMVACGDADAIVTGLNKNYFSNFEDISKVIKPKAGQRLMSYSIMVNKEHNVIIADTSVTEMPSAKDLAEITIQTAKIAKNMGYMPRVALLSFSTFGNPFREQAHRIRQAIEILDQMQLDFEYDGDMSADIALKPELRQAYPFCRLTKPANVLIMPDLHSASISTQLLHSFAAGTFIGPILNGFEHPVQIVEMGSSANEIVKIAAFAAIDAINNRN